MMRNIKTFEAFLREADEEKPKGQEGSAEGGAEEPKKPSIDPDKEKMKDYDINGKTYKGVLSTFEAIAKKQEAMGSAEVGVISLPGEDAAYELFAEEKEEDDDDDESEGGEEKKAEGGEETPSI
jgi:hypothetical protein